MNTRPYAAALPIAATAILLVMALPVIVVVYYAFSPTGLVRFPPSGMTLHWFVNGFANDRLRHALFSSLLIAAIVTPVTLAVAVPTSIALVRRRFPGRAVLNALALSPLVIPGVVSGVAFLNFFTWAGLASGFWRIAVALVCVTLPFAIRALAATLEGLDPALEEAARNLGSRGFGTFLWITLPQLWPGLLAGGIFVFVESVDNFSVVVFLTDLRTSVLPVEIYGYIRDFDDPTVAAMATVLIVQSVLLVWVMQRFVGMARVLDLRR